MFPTHHKPGLRNTDKPQYSRFRLHAPARAKVEKEKANNVKQGLPRFLEEEEKQTKSEVTSEQ